jgi:hypothetical protein
MQRRALQRWGALFIFVLVICVLESLSPHGKLLDWTTPGYPGYGEADNIIPWAVTLWMAGEMLSTVFSHLELYGPKPGAMDQWRLLHFLL